MADPRRGGRPAPPGKIYGAPGAGYSGHISLLTAVALLGLWFLITNTGMVKPLFLPSPQAVYEKFIQASVEGVANSTLWEHTQASLSRVFGAFILACVTAIPVGILMGVSRIARGIFDPPIEFYRPLPPLAYLPLVIIWFGIGEFPKIFLIYLAIFAPMAIAARAGVRSVSIEQIHAAYAMGAAPADHPARHPEGRPAGNLYGHAHRHRRGLDHAGGGGNGGRGPRPGLHGAERGAVPRQRYGHHGNHRHRRLRVRFRPAGSPTGESPDPLERPRLNPSLRRARPANPRACPGIRVGTGFFGLVRSVYLALGSHHHSAASRATRKGENPCPARPHEPTPSCGASCSNAKTTAR